MKGLNAVFHAILFTACLLASPVLPAADEETGLEAAPVVNINQAGADELAEALTGVGETKAEAIVRYREKHGDFLSASGLTQVRGIGDATVSKNSDRIRLE